MKSSTRGADTSQAEVSNIDRFGLWILVQNKEYFLPYDEFPWFRQGTVEQILKVELLHQDHLYWPELDVDLCIDSLAEPTRFPLIYR
jgi:hypothetical protein